MVENLTFFTEDEDLKSIVLANLDEEVVDIKKISTGWTNIVLDVKCKDNSYIFRFPRNNFFSNIIEKDVEANKFLKEHTNIKVVDMRLCYDKNRPFSIHKKIEGKTLMTRMNDFLFTLSKIDDNDIQYNYQELIKLKNDEDNSNNIVFVYGDMNAGNIILNEDDSINAFIDYSFCNLSDTYCDLSRISPRINRNIFDKILGCYESFSNKKIDMKKIEDRNKMWNIVEKHYIEYIKKYHPEIKY